MKKFNLLLTAITLLLLSSSVLNAQNARNPWALTVGAHAVDFTSVRSVGDEFFNTNNYSIVPPLSKLSIIRNLNRSFDLDLTASVGEVDNERLRVYDEFFINAGLGLRYKLANGYIFGENSWFDPYLRIGANYNQYDYTGVSFPITTYEDNTLMTDPDVLQKEVNTSKDHFGLSGGAGINFWFTKNFGLNVASDYNWIPATETDYFDFFQHTVGVTFRFGNTDRDGDGIVDDEDACPDTPGVASTDPECNGCPDSDGDGICDSKDNCPEVAGPVSNQGCPEEAPVTDRDGDGIDDVNDDCPDTPGVASSIDGCNGCPDSDGDGICDSKDNCPSEAGPVSNDGCPIKLNCDDSKAIREALRSVLFEYNSSELTAESKVTLDAVAAILKSPKAKDAHWLIEGHTDSKGTQAYNLPLSVKRSNSVKAYLEGKGVSAHALKSVGFGEELPITTNDTAEGRARNRRVELKYADANFQLAALPVVDDECTKYEIGELSKFIYFSTGTYNLIESSKSSLDVIALYIKNTGKDYEIQGHTDNVGSEVSNLTLSQKRAQTVVDYLISKGVSAAKLKAVGYGEAQPKYDNNTADGRAQNRRIEVVAK